MKPFACFAPFAALALAASLVPASSAASAADSSSPSGSVTPGGAMVQVVKATNACFSDTVRVTGFIVPRREAVAGVDGEGSKVSELLVREGDSVTENQELARLVPLVAGAGRASSLRAPAAGLVISVNTIAGAPASPVAGPMFKIAVGGDIELDAEVPSIHVMKLSAGAVARISRDDRSDVPGKVRLVSPQIDRTTQLGHVRLSFASNPGLRVGTFARAAIDARRSCGVSVPRSAIDHLTVQVVKGSAIETRKVRVGLTSDTATEILEGVEVGDLVVADAGTSLHDGDQVRSMLVDELDRSRVR
ncbi:MAG: efflux RND transporter periplasmic adaptor subunit [Tardiphaga sp.]|uniref:efflux RND transporter periplasmic adaptor subunit n=1 Tax=Tardiphaga sp. TaxID=1926292 RepID=UPI001982B71D|nr:efflux RND transporter periplasmic adaptor subunit [Tardiphaga sp.]MBC7582385.1 efflux RND transporter periplasmic adaptor subunit [Tardiphaga sp.]